MDTLWKILITSAVCSVVIMMEVLACIAFPNNGTEFSLLYVLFPLLLAPVPFALLRLCGAESGFMADAPKGLHWAEFATAFIGAGIIAVPVMLQVSSSIRPEALALSLGGVALLAIFVGVSVYLGKREDDTFSNF